ncbi:MAG: PEP-CTERM sorting domain-containing protein [Pirellulales bacterium]|nr:PEP-CTERM sorting domain-containing protein [Pirellulales bacterium]
MLVLRRLMACVVLGVVAIVATTAQADPMALIDPGLPGTTQYDGWASGSLTTGANPGFPGFPGTGAWPSAIGSSAPGSGDATLMKVANGAGGGPYPGGGSIYYGGFSGDSNVNGGTLSVADSTPVSGVKNVVFQIQIGEASTYDFFNDILPTLNYNGGVQQLAATNNLLLEQFFNGTIDTPTGPEDVFINTYLLQWDLTPVGSVTDFNIDWNGVQHVQVYALRLDQSDHYEAYAVPEPTSIGLALMGGLGLIGARAHRAWRRRRAS